MSAADLEVWPPKFWKFHLTTASPNPVQLAFTDPRRFGRVRLVDCPGDAIRQNSPLVENGPDPVIDTETFTLAYLNQKMRSRHVPIKALLLDQTVISGIGNWVGDEVLYHARLHPEQYCDEFSDEQIKRLYESIRHVCQFAVDKLGDSDQFPEDWLFHYRWGKGQKGAAGHLPTGEKLAFLTVGGRTSCYVPALQKKSGHIAPGVKEELVESGEEDEKPKKPARAKGGKEKVKEEQPQPKRKVKEEEAEEAPAKKKRGQPKKESDPATDKVTKAKETSAVNGEAESGRRRSSRLQGKAS
jgi:formamidopyrimidine-DNA glycosylase